jgi:c(7)-type cytochrome triheme protein
MLALLVGLIGFLGALSAQRAWAGELKGPADFDFDGKGQGKVAFSHEKHAAKNPKCTDCHTKVFKMTKGQRSVPKMADMEKGESCGTCHNGTVAFGVKEQATCAKCHRKT